MSTTLGVEIRDGHVVAVAVDESGTVRARFPFGVVITVPEKLRKTLIDGADGSRCTADQSRARSSPMRRPVEAQRNIASHQTGCDRSERSC